MQTKTRVLWVGEFHTLNTGYSVYCRELLSRLSQNPDLEVAELACYCSPVTPGFQQSPWKVYPNLPHPEDKDGMNRYQSNPANALGVFSFDNVVMDFKPHIVIDIRDVFAFSFEDISPLRDTFTWLVMPTVDAEPQNPQWLDILSRADSVLTYQDWSMNVLRKQTNNKLNLRCSADPAADTAFRPKDKKECKTKFGLEDFKVMGTVMRNQPRKQFPALFKAFAQYLKQSKREDVLLHCHTSFPDNSGWDFPRLLNQYGIASKVLFTYICHHCREITVRPFSGTICGCNRCGHGSCMMPNVQVGVNNDELSDIYNSMDVYVQYANSEGMGMPAVEAGACGVPVLATKYSAMEDVVKRLGGIHIPIYNTYIDRTMGCERANPNQEAFVNILTDVFNKSDQDMQEWSERTRLLYNSHYSWDSVADRWLQVIQSSSGGNSYRESRWHKQPQIIHPPQPEYNMSNADFAIFLIKDVLCQPELLYTYMHARLEKELNLGQKDANDYGMYYHVCTAPMPKEKFTKETVYKHFVELRSRLNSWENQRWQENGRQQQKSQTR